jgi:hypothetical protein
MSWSKKSQGLGGLGALFGVSIFFSFLPLNRRDMQGRISNGKLKNCTSLKLFLIVPFSLFHLVSWLALAFRNDLMLSYRLVTVKPLKQKS